MRVPVDAVREKSSKEIAGALILLFVVMAYFLFVWFFSDIELSQWFELFLFYIPIVSFILFFLLLVSLVSSLVISDLKAGGKTNAWLFFKLKIGSRWRQDCFFSILWPLICFLVLIVSFNIFKQVILLQRGFLYDDILVEWDRLIFGSDPGVLMHQMVNWPWLTFFMDQVYHTWFLPMLVGVILVAAYGGHRLRLQYMLTWVSCWILLGTVMAWLVPSAGPCFYDVFVSEKYEFDFLMGRLQGHNFWLKDSVGLEVSALKYQQMLESMVGSQKVSIGGGISAFPSVHNALAVLFALAAFSVNKLLGWIMTLFSFLIWIGSIYLGWHYAVDGLFSAIFVVALWFFYGWLIRVKF